MNKINNKGFTLVEILAVIAILGILSGIAIGAVQRYINNAREQAYDTLASSSVEAMKEYVMDNPSITRVNFSTLKNDNYISNLSDPTNSSDDCIGLVSREKSFYGDGVSLDDYDYRVYLCCANKNYIYNYKSDQKDNKKETESCELKINVSFESNGGTAVATKQVTYGEKYGGFTLPKKSGYYFAGWYSDIALTKKVSTSTIVSNEKDHTLYAKWKQNV